MPRNKGTFWDEFEKIVNTKGQERMKCKTCNKSWAKNETRMQEHYNYCRLKNSGNSNTSSSTSSFFTNADQKELESLLARGFYSAGISFNILENDDIKAFFSRALPYFKLPTRYSLSNSLLTKEYSDLNTVINYLLNETQFLCLVTDGWSNIRKDSIINFMITTPKPLFYKSVHTKEDQHTAQNIAEGIDKVMQELGVDKFVAVVTDNAPNMKAAWRILKNQYPTKVFLGCWAHGINLWIKDILKLDWPKNVLETSKEIINYFRNHNIPLAALRRLQIEKYGHIISLVQTVDTRWGSAFYCMDHLLQTKNAIRSLLIEESIGISPNIKIHLMNDLFWQNLKYLRNFLEPFVKFIHELEGDVPLLSAVFLKLRQLETTIRNNDYVPTIVITENPNKWDAPIERELIRLAGPENEDQVLELSEYVGKTSRFSANYLWDNIVNLELNKTNSVEKNNIDDSLSDSPLYIDSMDYADEIDDMDINEHIDDLDSIDNMINIDNMDNMDNIDSINDMGNDEK
ncbi:27945_t:CDS:2 [Gigaspora margarita]|uniref:27945_t:CDS:1 n=1 Tax=Gigaspora margarita TaxID=4874 RepID=A0ABN7W2K6_GIGMA|nr:27945_t:CDS:2 [Gigaspora margarita]